MAENNVVGLDVIARLDGFRAELAKIPDIGAKEAKALTAQLSREIKAAETAAKRAAAAAKETGDKIKNAGREVGDFGDAAGKAGSNAAKLAGALDLAVPGAGELARGLADLADVGEVAAVASGALGVSLGTIAAVAAPIALVIGGIALAWSEYQETAEQAEQAQRDLLAAIEDVGDISDSSRTEIDKLRVNLGQWTQAQADDAEVNRVWDERLEQGTAALRAHRDELVGATKDVTSTATAQAAHAEKIAEVNRLIESATTLNEQGRAAALANAEIARETAESEEVLAERLRAKNEAERRGAEAARETAEAEREHAAAMAAATAQAAAYAAALEAIEGIAAKADASQLEGIDKIAAARDAQFAQITDQQQAAIEAGLGNVAAIEEADRAAAEARDAVWRSYYEQLGEYNDKLYATMADNRARDAAAEGERLARTQDAAVSTALDVTRAVQAVADTVGQIAEEGTERQKKLAAVAFRVSQVAAVGETVITTAAAAMKAYDAALALGPPGLVLAPIAAAATAAFGAAQVATIATESPPTFHAGLAPDEIPATLTRGEGVLTPRGVAANGGPEGVRRANRGESTPERPIVVAQVYQHRVFDAAVADNLQIPGSPLRRAVRAGRRVGHRQRN